MEKIDLDFQLTKEQKKHCKTIEWLLSVDEEDRRTGRSYLMATVFVVNALKYPGMKIHVFDHYPALHSAVQTTARMHYDVVEILKTLQVKSKGQFKFDVGKYWVMVK